jgi:Flp pilus assembly CpaF family ATPase
LSNQHRSCKIVIKNPVNAREHIHSENKLSLLCKKPEGEVCARNGTTPDLCANPACMSRVVNYLVERDVGERIGEISIISPFVNRIYTHEQVKMIREISEVVMRFHKEADDLEKRTFRPKCQNPYPCSKIWREFIQKIKSDNFLSSDPIKAYIYLLAEKRSWSERRQVCISCRKACLNFLESLRRILVNTTLMSRFLQLKLNYNDNDREIIYSYFFRPMIVPRTPQTYGSESTGDSHLAEEYAFGPYKARILVDSGQGENVYSVTSLANGDSMLHGIVAEITSQLRNVPQVTPKSTRLLSLDELLQIRNQEAEKITRQRYPELPQELSSSIAELSCYESVGIGSISAFLVDDNVEEFFIDQPGASLYLDHRKWGRCKTNVVPAFSELKKVETRLRSESGFRLDRLNPSIKTEISTRRFAVRASIDISPLAADGFHLDVRKLERRHLSLAALVENGTISSEAAAYLYFCILRKINIVAVGEPGSGKTTMINALDLLTPSSWRKITIEDALESIPQREFGKHQVRLRVEPFEERRRLRSKSREIISLLHRTPDLIYLGEIQTASHSKAMFHALSAGLTGLQTCHADSPEQALVRWVIHHNVPPICLGKIGIIIHMKKLSSGTENTMKRRVVRICEVKEDLEKDNGINFSSSSAQLVDVFRWDPVSAVINRRIDLFETPVLHSMKKYEALTRRIFEEEIGKYKSLFEMLVERKEIEIDSTTKLFSEVSKHQIDMREDTLNDSAVTTKQEGKPLKLQSVYGN